MSKKMLINATLPEENRVAIVEDGILTELDIEVAGHEQAKGNIYKAVVVRVEPGLQAAFVDYGAERLGFLQIDEINFKHIKPKNQENGRGRPRITDLLSRGQELLVQVTKEERGTKGAALTTYLSLAGRYMVLMPDSTTRGVSRKAENDAQRKQLKQAMASLDLPEKFGYIVRTAALDQTREELERDYRYLMRLYESICALDEKTRGPALIYKETNLVIRSIRDYFTTDMDEVLIDDPEVFKEAKSFFQVVMPDYAGLVKLHQERRPIFSRYQIEDQIETISSNKVALPSGGSIVIDTTEALVAIDVNSGKMASEQGVEATATKTNLEAAKEVARQLRLRDLGGLVVVDFIDMRERKHNRQVEEELRKAMASDKARVSIGKISQFGLLELSRQRIRGALAEGAYRPCPHCHGAGRIKSPETLAAALLRRIHTGVAKGQVGQVHTRLPLEVASYLLNNRREELLDMERRYNVIITVHGQPDFMTDQVEIDFQKREKETNNSTDLAAAEILKTLAEKTAQPGEKTAESSHSEDAPKRETSRRRRRRKKPAQEAKAADQQDAATQEERTGETVSQQANEATETGEQAPQPAKKPARRSRSRAKAAQAPVESAEATTSQSPEGKNIQPDAPDTAATEEPGETVKKPTRRRSGRTRAKAKNEEKAAEQTAAPQAEGAEQQTPSSEDAPAAPATAKADSASTEKKPRRPRRSRAKSKPADTEPAFETGARSTESADAQAESATAAPAETPEPEKAEKKPARRRSSRSRAKATDKKQSGGQQAEQEQAETPARNDVPSTIEPPNAVDQPAEESTAPKKPRRTTRRKPATNTAKSAETESQLTEDAAAVESSAETAKPKRRRTPRKKKEETTE